MEEPNKIQCEDPGILPVKGKDTKYKIIVIILAVAILAGITMLPLPSPIEISGEEIPLTWGGKAVMAMLVFAIILWVTEVIPFSVTALLVMILIPAFGLETFEETIRLGFGNPIIAFFIGVLMLSSAFTRSGLGKRLSLFILRVMGTKTSMVILGFLIFGALLSMWITDMAVAAILMPLGVSILRECNLKPLQSNFGRALMISCAWGPLFGGIATPAGCGPNILTISFLKELANIDINFLDWMILGFPAAMLMIPMGWLILLKFFPPEIKNVPFKREDILKDIKELGSFTAKEKWTTAIFLTTITLWVGTPLIKSLSGGAIDLPMQAVALAGGLLLFLPGIEIINWTQARKDIDWGGIVLICAGISLGMVVYGTGAARWLAWVFLSPVVELPTFIMVILIVLIVAGLHLAFSSNTVTGTIIIPLLIALALDLGINPWLITAPAAFTASLAFILVTETPTNVIPYSSGYFSIKDMAKAGIVMTFAASLAVAVSIMLFGNLSGLYGF